MIARFPLRWKLALWSSLVCAAALMVFAIFTSINLYFALINEEDEEVASATGNLLRQYEDAISRGQPFSPSPTDSWLNYGIFDAEGRIVYRTKGLDEAVIRAALVDGTPSSRMHEGILWRVHAKRAQNGCIVSCYDLRLIRDEIRHLAFAFLFSIPLVSVVVAAGALFLSRYTLAPIRELADIAQEMHATGLDRRIPLPPAKDEIQRLAQCLNDLFARLQTSFEQASRFSADASHELRTPLTVIRGQIEALVRKSADQPAVEIGLVVLQEEVARLERTTEHLLQLSRFDAGKAPGMVDELDFSALVRCVCEDAELLATSSNVRMCFRLEDGIRLRGNPDLLRQFTLNLLENAALYNESGGRIECSLSRSPTMAVLAIGNTGPGIAVGEKDRLFTRFYRGNPSRSDRRGQGLGLSLSRAIVRIHGGDLVLSDTSRPGWTEFTATLPLG